MTTDSRAKKHGITFAAASYVCGDQKYKKSVRFPPFFVAALVYLIKEIASYTNQGGKQ